MPCFFFEAFRRGDTHSIQLHGDRAVIIAKILYSTGILSKLYCYRDVGVMYRAKLFTTTLSLIISYRLVFTSSVFMN